MRFSLNCLIKGAEIINIYIQDADMMNDNYEKDFEDEVYEDEYYEEHYEEEELEEEGEFPEEVAEDDDAESDSKKIHVSFACDDCDYRWDDLIAKNKEEYDDEDEIFDVICPMCGSINITQI